MNLASLSQNKLLLGVLTLVLIAIIGYGMLYTKGKEIRDKETTSEQVKRCIGPAAIVSVIITGSLYYFKGSNADDQVLSNQDYFD
jgi:amino acid transporter